MSIQYYWFTTGVQYGMNSVYRFTFAVNPNILNGCCTFVYYVNLRFSPELID